MALTIRLTRVGRRKSPHYRVVVAEASMPRDGRFVEIIGHYQPLKAEIKLEIKEDRALHWLHIGAQPSDTVRSLMRKKGIMKLWHEQREEMKRARKAGETAAPPVAAEVEAPVEEAPAEEAPAEEAPVEEAPAEEAPAEETPET